MTNPFVKQANSQNDGPTTISAQLERTTKLWEILHGPYKGENGTVNVVELPLPQRHKDLYISPEALADVRMTLGYPIKPTAQVVLCRSAWEMLGLISKHCEMYPDAKVVLSRQNGDTCKELQMKPEELNGN